MVNILASLAAETTHNVTHEDDVSVLSPVMLPLSAEEKREMVEETLEMSQRVWDEDVQPANDDAAADSDEMYVLYWPTSLFGLVFAQSKD